jgi:hypothetical protein
MKMHDGVISLVIVSAFVLAQPAQADHGFAQFGASARSVAPGEGVEFVLGGHDKPGASDASVSYHVHLFFNEERPDGPPESTFSAGDVLRFTLGDTSIIYEFDQPSNILNPPFLSFGFFNASNIDDIFGNGDPIGMGLSAAAVDGQRMALEVLAGDGVRFSGLELGDLDAGTNRKAGASTFVRKFSIAGGDNVTIDFDELASGDTLTSQYSSKDVEFWGDVIFDEQFIVDRIGVGIDVIDAKFMVNASAAPPLGRRPFVGLSFARPVHAFQFDYATTATNLRVAGFDGEFAPETLTFVETFTPAVGPSIFLEGTASVVHPEGFDGIILPANATLLLDHVDVTFRRIAVIDFEGFSTDSQLRDQLEALGVHFFGDGIENEQAVIDTIGVGYERLNGNFLVNDSLTPPTGASGMVGMSFDGLVSKVSFDFASPSPLEVITFRGGFTPEHIVEVLELTTSTSTSGFGEGEATLMSPGGFDGLVVADDSSDGVAIDHLVVEFSQP